MDELGKKCILLGGFQKWTVDALLKFPKLPKDMVSLVKGPKWS